MAKPPPVEPAPMDAAPKPLRPRLTPPPANAATYYLRRAGRLVRRAKAGHPPRAGSADGIALALAQERTPDGGAKALAEALRGVGALVQSAELGAESSKATLRHLQSMGASAKPPA